MTWKINWLQTCKQKYIEPRVRLLFPLFEETKQSSDCWRIDSSTLFQIILFVQISINLLQWDMKESSLTPLRLAKINSKICRFREVSHIVTSFLRYPRLSSLEIRWYLVWCSLVFSTFFQERRSSFLLFFWFEQNSVFYRWVHLFHWDISRPTLQTGWSEILFGGSHTL